VNRTASCSCGQLRVTCEGDPVRISMCHCLACQKRTGSTFGAQARWPSDQATIEGTASEYVRIGDSGNKVIFSFCPRCGSTVHYRIDRDPGLIAVALGAFADPTFPPPKFSVYESRMHPWTGVPANAEHME